MILSHLCRKVALAGHAGETSTIIEALEHEEPKVRVVALSAASRLNLLDAQCLRQFLADPSAEVRYRTIELAARSSIGVDVGEDLVKLLDDPELTEISAFALGELSIKGPVLREATQKLGAIVSSDSEPLNREAAVAALGALGVGREFILTATEDIATVRRRAVLALAPFDGPEVEEALQRALTDRDWQVRQAAEDLTDPQP